MLRTNLARIGGAWIALALLHGGVGQAQDDGEEENTGPVAMQRIYVVAAAIDPELEAVAARAGAAARAAMRRVPGADWQAADQRYLGYDDNTLMRLREAREALAAGRAAYLELRLDEATQLLQSAVENFNQALSALEDPSDLGDALLYLGASQSFNGDTRAARETFERLHAQMPHIQPDPEIFPPDVVSRYEEAAPRRTDGVITVESDPPGAVAYIDFIPRGLTPVTVDGLARGEHSVRTASPGSTPYIENAQITRRQTEHQITAFLMAIDGAEGLADAVGGITGHELQEGDGPIATVAQVLELDKIGVIRVSYGDSRDTVKLELVMFDAASGRRLLRGEVMAPRALGELEEVVGRSIEAAIENVLRPTQGNDDENIIGQEIVVDPVGTTNDDDDEDSIVGKWWFWTAIGGAVVLGAVIAIAVVASGGEDLGQDRGGQVVFEF